MVLLKGKSKDSLYVVDSSPQPQHASFTAPQAYLTNQNHDNRILTDWHNKLGHPSQKTLSQILKSCNVKISNENVEFYTACQFGKSHKLPFNLSETKPTKPLELVHSDLWGPAPLTSNQGFKYYINFLDDFSRFSWIYPLKTKDEALLVFKQFKLMAEKLLDMLKRFILTLEGNLWLSLPF